MMVGRLWWKIFLKFKKTHISKRNLKRLVDRWWWWAGCGGRKQRFCASNYHHQHHHPAKKHTWDWESKYLSKLGSLGGVFWGRSMPPIITTSTTTRNTHGNGNPKYHNQTTTTIKNSAPLPCQETHLGERGGDRDHIFIKIWNFWGGILRQKYGLKHVFFSGGSWTRFLETLKRNYREILIEAVVQLCGDVLQIHFSLIL